jgi:tetratricopeptide (TPR) repeat protein
MTAVRGVVGVACVAMLAVTIVAVAPASAEAPKNKAAMGALELAKHHYKQENFKKAATLFLEAYEIAPHPAFLFNAGRAQQRAFLLGPAEATFRKYLKEEKDDKLGISRAKMHLTEITAIQKQLEQARSQVPGEAKAAPVQSSLTTPPSQDELREAPKTAARAAAAPAAKKQQLGDSLLSTPPLRKSSGSPVVGWSSTIGGVLLGAAGGYFFVQAEAETKKVVDAEVAGGKIQGISHKEYVEAKDNVSNYRLYGAVGTGLGAVAIGTGLYLLFSDSDKVAVSWLPGAGGGLGTASISF